MLAYQSAFSSSSIINDTAENPREFKLSTSKTHTIGMFFLVLPGVLIAGAVPLVLASMAASSNMSLLGFAANQPLVAAQLVFATILATALVWPALKALVWRLGRNVRVSVDDNTVTVTEKHLLKSKNWSEPVRNYRGLVRQTVATAGGFREHLVMVHDKHEHAVLLHIAPEIQQGLVDRCCEHFDLPELSDRRGSAATMQFNPSAGLRERLAMLRNHAPAALDNSVSDDNLRHKDTVKQAA